MLPENYSVVPLFLLFLALVFLLEKPVQANVTIRCKESERQALLDFKKSLAVVNESDTFFSSWRSGDDKGDCCNWTRVECSESGHVVKLDLSLVIGDVRGTISPSLLELRYLSYLDLSGNDFNGSSVPVFIGSLSELTFLKLSDSGFSGPIPSQLGNLSRLDTLDLSSNQLTGSIPGSFGNLVALRDLSLRDNLLDGEFPKSLWNICSLQWLRLGSNNLGGDVFGGLQSRSMCTTYSLEELYFGDNQFTGSVPDEIAKLSSLGTLRVRNNHLNGSISQSIGQLSNLKFLDLSGNSFDGVVISEAHFSNLSNLIDLDLSDTSLALKFNPDWIPPFQLETILLRSCKLGPSFPQWIQTQDTANQIDISASGISGSLPSSFWNTSRVVTSLNLSFNQITGSLPQNINLDFTSYNGCASDDACFLDLSSNNFTGLLPKLPNYYGFLRSINLSNNKLFGSITSICENITSLTFVDLSNNLFSGVIPNCFAQWERLTVLNLAENDLSGPVPMSIGSATDLEMLSLRSNNLSGPLPPSLQNCSRLNFLDLSDNKLSGNIPEWIGQSFSQLIFLSLESNQFHGSIPLQLCELSNLQILDLSANKLSGPIPKCLHNFTSMSRNVNLTTTIEHSIITVRYFPNPDPNFLYVDEALLTWKGKKQQYAKILGLLLVIDLSGNQLTGEIPDELTSLQELVALNLSRNILKGNIPTKIGQLRQLQALDLSRNKLSGSIPPSLSKLTFLGTLDLSYNDLSGEIPKGTQIQGFDPSMFSHNNGLCGPPVTPNCSGPAEPPQGQPGRDKDDYDEFMKWLYAGMGLGFAVGFWGFCGAVFFKRSWRHSYFRFLDNLNDWLYLAFVLHKTRLGRRIRA
ncbi:hypothetical protein PTKIN_Ptkin14bG0126600 [Pterospermum kingtungense]